MSDSNEQIASEISLRIKGLLGVEAENLKGEMQALKSALLENPAACLLLHSEDVGIMVDSLRKMTGKAIIAASTKKTTTRASTKAKALTPEQLKMALESDDF